MRNKYDFALINACAFRRAVRIWQKAKEPVNDGLEPSTGGLNVRI